MSSYLSNVSKLKLFFTHETDKDLSLSSYTIVANHVFCSASSLGMMSEEERKMQRIEDIKELLS